MFGGTKVALPAAVVFGMIVSAVNPAISTSRPYRLSRWSQVTCRIAEWRLRARSRNELKNLSDRTLRDIGVSRFEAELEASKPFWMA
jgi:uncharacterized protein YjiS (DUF1127 family)